MFIRLAIILCMLMLCACGGSQNSDMPDAVTKSAPIMVSPDPVVVFMGDSITQNWGPGVPSLQPVSPTLYQLIPGVIDKGIAGQTTAQMLARFNTDILALHPSVVVIEGGTNDVLYISDPTIDNVAMMASEAAAAGVTVIIATIPPTDHDPASQALILQFNAQLRTLAKAYGYQLVDYYSVLVDSSGALLSTDFQPDTIHPDSAGYEAMWSVLKPLLVQDFVIVTDGPI